MQKNVYGRDPTQAAGRGDALTHGHFILKNMRKGKNFLLLRQTDFLENMLDKCCAQGYNRYRYCTKSADEESTCFLDIRKANRRW